MFSLQVGHCVYWVYIILIIIIVVVVYDYYLSSLLAEDWHFEICLSLNAIAEKNKLLLLILFHESLDCEIFCPRLSFSFFFVCLFFSFLFLLSTIIDFFFFFLNFV